MAWVSWQNALCELDTLRGGQPGYAAETEQNLAEIAARTEVESRVMDPLDVPGHVPTERDIYIQRWPKAFAV